MTEKQNYIQNEFSETWVENGVIHQIIAPHIIKVDLIIAKELVAARKAASGGVQKIPVLCILNNAINIKSDAKEYYRTEDSFEDITALALVMDNYIAKLLVTLVFNISKPIIPTAIFNSEENALNWLSSYKTIN